jgi:hypothetical protein
MSRIFIAHEESEEKSLGDTPHGDLGEDGDNIKTNLIEIKNVMVWTGVHWLNFL